MNSSLGSNLSELDRLLLELNAVQQSTPAFATEGSFTVHKTLSCFTVTAPMSLSNLGISVPVVLHRDFLPLRSTLLSCPLYNKLTMQMYVGYSLSFFFYNRRGSSATACQRHRPPHPREWSLHSWQSRTTCNGEAQTCRDSPGNWGRTTKCGESPRWAGKFCALTHVRGRLFVLCFCGRCLYRVCLMQFFCLFPSFLMKSHTFGGVRRTNRWPGGNAGTAAGQNVCLLRYTRAGWAHGVSVWLQSPKQCE